MIIKKRNVTTRDNFFIALFNRYCSIFRCREAATELVMILVPLCLRARRLCLRKAFIMLEIFVAQHDCVYDKHLQVLEIFRINFAIAAVSSRFCFGVASKSILFEMKIIEYQDLGFYDKSQCSLFQNPKRFGI